MGDMARRRRRKMRGRLIGWTLAAVALGVFGYIGGQHLLAAPNAPRGGTGSGTQPSSSPIASSTPSPTPTASSKPSPTATPLPSHYLIHVTALDQYPQLPNGCEVTSLTMLMDAVGHPSSKMTLAAQMPKDPTPLQLTTTTNASGQAVHHVKYWGNPNVGFVGSVYKAGDGYGIYHGPMTRFLNQLLPGRAEDLTGQPFQDILRHVAQGIPVEVWTTTTFQPTTDWVSWQSPEGLVTATPLEHAVLLVGYGPGVLYINNPLNGEAAEKIPEGPFLKSWKQLGQQALTVKAKQS